MSTVLAGAIDALLRLQGGLKSSYARDLGQSAGLGNWTAWLNVPFSVIVGWVFISLEKVGENSSNPFEGGSTDVPISFIARKIESEMRMMLGERTDLRRGGTTSYSDQTRARMQDCSPHSFV
jgi:hypothetical protein